MCEMLYVDKFGKTSVHFFSHKGITRLNSLAYIYKYITIQYFELKNLNIARKKSIVKY